jgi:hypothetical protein
MAKIAKLVREFFTAATVPRLITDYGTIRSTERWAPGHKRMRAVRYSYEQRSEIALAVASMFPGGDYFEFGSESLSTFRSFLSAFDLNGMTEAFPDARFYAFDVFGEIDSGVNVPLDERWYFDGWGGHDKLELSKGNLRKHGLLLDRCRIVQGYFQDTLSADFKASLLREQRTVGFAFLDCNITSSYQVCFDFLSGLLNRQRAYIYMDEYFVNKDVPPLFEEFAARLLSDEGLAARYMRSAGAFGALFNLMPAR